MREEVKLTTRIFSPKFNKTVLAKVISLVFTTSTFSGLALAENTKDNDEDTEVIMVVGQKVSRTLQDTLTSVSVLNAEIIEQQSIGNFSDALLEMANVSITGTDNRASRTFNIRGVDNLGVSGVGSSALATVYVDDAPLPASLTGSGFSTWDVSQIEVYRGPQSTLQGRNSLAGAIIVNTQTPTNEWKGKYRLEVGEYGQKETAIAFGGGIIDDQLAFRFSAESEELDGFNDNIARNEESDFVRKELYRLKVLLTPDAIPDFSAQLIYTHASAREGSPSVDIPESGNPFNQRVTTNNDPQKLTYSTDIVNLKMDYLINDVWSSSYIATYSKVDSGWEDFDDDYRPISDGTRHLSENNKTYTQELRFVFDYDSLTGVIGAYYSDQEIPIDFGGITRIGLASSGITAENFQYQFGLDEDTANFVIDQFAGIDPVVLDQVAFARDNISTYAIFTDITYQLNDHWDVVAGIRWDKEKQENRTTRELVFVNQAESPDPSNYPEPLDALIGGINDLIQANIADASETSPALEASFTEFIPKIGMSYHWNEDVTSSFIIQQGYRSGGVDVNITNGEAYEYDSETTIHYEFSFRSLWLEGKLTANANIYYADWKNQQINIQLSEDSLDHEIRNAGKSTMQGFEVELNYRVTPEFTFYSSIGQADTEFTDFVNDGEDLSGRSFPGASEWTANMGATYQAESGIFANVSINYADESKLEADPFFVDKDDPFFDPINDSRTLVNAKVGYEWNSFGLYLVAKNLLDEEYISNAGYGPNEAETSRRRNRHTLGAPRQLSLSLRGKF